MTKRFFIAAAAFLTAFTSLPVTADAVMSTPYIADDTVKGENELWDSCIAFDENGSGYVSLLKYKGKESDIYIPQKCGDYPVGDINVLGLIDGNINEKMKAENKAVFHIPDGVGIVYYEFDYYALARDIPDGFTVELVFPSGEVRRLTSLYDGVTDSSASVDDLWDYTVLHGIEGQYEGDCIRLDRYKGRGEGSYSSRRNSDADWNSTLMNDHVIINFPAEINGMPVAEIGENVLGTDMNLKYPLDVRIPEGVKVFDKGCLDNPSVSRLSVGTDISYECLFNDGGEKRLAVDNINISDADIPESVAGYPVRSVNSNYGGRSEVSAVKLPDSINNFDFCAFRNCQKLERINIPDGVKIIPTLCFAECPLLSETENIGNVQYIAKKAFKGSEKAVYPKEKEVNNCPPIMDSQSAFTVCDRENGWCYIIHHNEEKPYAELVFAPDMKNLSVPDTFMGLSVKENIGNKIPVGADTFIVTDDDFRFNLKYTYIDYSVYPNLKKYMRKKRTSSSSFSRPRFKSEAENLIYSAPVSNFSNIIVLKKNMDFGGGNGISLPVSSDGDAVSVNFHGNVHMAGYAFSGDLDILRFSGEDSTLVFDGNAMSANTLSELSFPKKCKDLSIGKEIFKKAKISELVIPEGTSYIGEGSFSTCSELKNIVVNGSPEIDKCAFENCDKLENVTFTGRPTLDGFTFIGCDSLKNIDCDMKQGFNDVNGSCFAGCFSLETINGEQVFNSDGSPVEKYREFIENEFRYSNNNGIINKYVLYRVRETLKEIITDDMTDMEKIKAIHDKICSMTVYDMETTDDIKNHNDVSVFLSDSTVCEGYARIFSIMLHEAGIESCYVCNATHAWDIVKLGGHYFHIDTTWDDGDTVKYSWFLKSDAEIKDKPSHKSWELREPSVLHTFQTKKMPVCSDIMGDVNSDGIVDGKDASAVLSAYAKASAGDGFDIDPIIGDVNFNGRVDAVDASAILTNYANESAER